MRKKFHESYARFIIIVYSLIFLFRVLETSLIIQSYGFDFQIVSSEFFGLFIDLLGSGLFIIAYAPVSYLLSRYSIKALKIINICLLIFSSLFFFVNIKFFLYQLIPLDVFLYQYSIREILFTISTSSTNLFQTSIAFILTLAVILLLAWGISKVLISRIVINILYCFVLVSIPLFFLIDSNSETRSDKFSLNKGFYFIGKSIIFLSSEAQSASSDAIEFSKLYPHKDFINKEYPLVYVVERENELGKYFNDFTDNPNIVILIVEGLNDDFIHEYKGSILMPFLSQLKNKSLYWNRCFTLGERSFAAVPSILGGLPYGDIGFTLQDRLPRHLSLVSILNSNNYYTTFFYGQGSWFHKKDRFFKYNDIDLIVDNSVFSNNYSKIIVGDDNFFWGYNDKDLFDQSLQVIDTLNHKPRFDIYFTGTSHSPYLINNEEHYDKRIKELTNSPFGEFYHVYSKYLKSVLFVDDALQDFFDLYSKRKDYENTVFIITGDHPMTEIPIENSLKRYHVPLLIFSEKLKGNQTFSNTVSHLDISETILSFLKDNLAHTPSISVSLGEELISKKGKVHKMLAFMNDNREVVDILYGQYYLAGDKLFKVDSIQLNIKEIENDSVKSVLKEKLNVFNNTSLYASRENKIISNEDFCKELHHQNIYSFQDPDSIVISSAYYNLADSIKLSNSDFVFDLSLNLSSVKESNISIVYQITNSNDSVLLWKNFGIEESNVTQVHIPVNISQVEDSVLYFKSYIWNQDNVDVSISDLNILVYRPEPNKLNGISIQLNGE